MRCRQCGSSFRLATWIMQCGECKDQYCTKCMKRMNGICYCEKCIILITRPPNITELMKLKSKDLQEYLNRHNITTFGLVEKRELVDLLCNRAIPVKSTKSATVLNKIFSNFETVINLPERINGQVQRNRSPPEERPIFASSSSGNLATDAQESESSQQSNTLPKERRPPRPPPPRPSAPSQEELSQATTSTSSSPTPKKLPQLSDYKTVEDLTNLSAKDLKMLLAYNRVDFKGCVEKNELLEKVKRLWQDNQKHKTDELPENVDDLCKLCMDAPLDCVLLECGHIATCIDCGKKLAECPICRQYVSRVVRTFKA